jgi:hypothetical protein
MLQHNEFSPQACEELDQQGAGGRRPNVEEETNVCCTTVLVIDYG